MKRPSKALSTPQLRIRFLLLERPRRRGTRIRHRQLQPQSVRGLQWGLVFLLAFSAIAVIACVTYL